MMRRGRVFTLYFNIPRKEFLREETIAILPPYMIPLITLRQIVICLNDPSRFCYIWIGGLDIGQHAGKVNLSFDGSSDTSILNVYNVITYGK